MQNLPSDNGHLDGIVDVIGWLIVGIFSACCVVLLLWLFSALGWESMDDHREPVAPVVYSPIAHG